MSITRESFQTAIRDRNISIIKEYLEENDGESLTLEDLKNLIPGAVEDKLSPSDNSDSEADNAGNQQDDLQMELEDLLGESQKNNDDAAKLMIDSQATINNKLEEFSQNSQMDTEEQQIESEDLNDDELEENEEDSVSEYSDGESTNDSSESESDLSQVEEILVYFINNNVNKYLLVQITINLFFEEMIEFDFFIKQAKNIGLKYFISDQSVDENYLLLNKQIRVEINYLSQYTCFILACMPRQLTDNENEILTELVNLLKMNEYALEYLAYYALIKKNLNYINWSLKNDFIPDFQTKMEANLTLLDIIVQKCTNSGTLKQLIEKAKEIHPDLFSGQPMNTENHTSIKKLLITAIEYNENAIKPLMVAADEVDIEDAKTVFNFAIENYQATLMILALKKLSTPDRIELIKEINNDGNTVLHNMIFELMSISHGYQRELCLAEKINGVDYECEGKIFKIIYFLLFYGAFTNIENPSGQTPFNLVDEYVGEVKQQHRADFEEDGIFLKKFHALFASLFRLDTLGAKIVGCIDNLIDSEQNLFEVETITNIFLLARERIIKKYTKLYLVKLELDFDENTASLLTNQLQIIQQNIQQNTLLSDKALSITRNLTEIAKILKLDSPELKISDLFELEQSKQPVTFYTYIADEGWIVLPGSSKNEIKKYILTDLLELARRNPWDDGICLIRRKILEKITSNSNYINKPAAELYQELEIIEAQTGYCGFDPSDDSDEEHIVEFEKRPRGEKETIKAYSKIMMKRGQIDNFFTKNKKLCNYDNKKSNSEPITNNEQIRKAKEKANQKRAGVNGKTTLHERQKIWHENIPADVANDLQLLSYLSQKGTLNEESIKMIGTQFFVAQYRGIHYNTDTWDKQARRKHRIADEQQQPAYSRAVYAMSNLDETKDSINLSQNETNRVLLEKNSSSLGEQIQYLRTMGPIQCKNKKAKDDHYTFASPYDAIQELYTKDYNKYHQWLENIFNKKQKGEIIEDPLEIAFLFSQGRKTVTLSTGDPPYHALLYAYGMKFYAPPKNDKKTQKNSKTEVKKNNFNSQEHSRLRPRWRSNGRAERPYSGKVYTYLFTPVDYTKLQSSHLVSMNNNGQVNINYEIISERETTFWSAIPQDKLIHQHVARYPSFHHDKYSKHFLSKYGLNEKMYSQYKQHITENNPHTYENHLAKLLLGEHLCAFYETQLIEDARLAAREKKGWLVYRDEHGGFSLVLPRLYPKPPKNQAEKQTKEGQAAEFQRDLLKNERKKRLNQPMPSGWLIDVCKKYKVQTGLALSHILSLLLEKSEEEIKQCLEVDNKNQLDNPEKNPRESIISQLTCIAKQYECQFLLESPKDQTLIINSSNSTIDNDKQESMELPAEKIYRLVYFGGGVIFGLIPKPQPTSTIAPSTFFNSNPISDAARDKKRKSLENNNSTEPKKLKPNG